MLISSRLLSLLVLVQDVSLSSRDKNENTDIGLSIVKKIVESKGGTIELQSQVGKGTTFIFSWRK